jgi:DNA-binding transcriptional ArsR family regulator
VLQDDIAYRLEQLADGGVDALLRSLHPFVRFDDMTLHIEKYYDGDAAADGRGVLLVPCAFAWPDVLVRTAQPLPVTVSYSPRGVGRLWDHHPSSRHAALAEVIGRTRANLLRLLDLPMATSQLATQLALSAPTLNAHLKALHAAGIVTARRDGRFVLYSRAPVGDLLLARD